MIAQGVNHDALKRVDRAEPDVQPFGPELLDGLGVPVGYMAFAGQGEVPGRVNQRTRRQQARAELYQPSADVINRGDLLLWFQRMKTRPIEPPSTAPQQDDKRYDHGGGPRY